MKKVILGTMISLALTACSNGIGSTSSTFGLVAQNASTTVTSSATPNQPNGKGDFRGGKGGDFKGGDFGGMFKDLNLTTEQQTKLNALRDSLKASGAPTQPNAEEIQKMKDAQTAVGTAFTGDKLDAVTLKTLLDAARPAMPATDYHLTNRANELLQTYNILTVEQRQKLEDLKKQMEANKPQVATDATIDANKTKMLDDLVTKFALTSEQKAAFVALQPAQVDRTAMDAKRKAADDAIQAELKSGNATVDSLKAILAKNEPDRTAEQTARIDAIVKLHDVLTADQRKQMVQFVLGHFGEKGGHEGGRGGEGFGGKGGHGPAPVAPPATPAA